MIQQTGAWMVGIVDKKKQTHIKTTLKRVSTHIMTIVLELQTLLLVNTTIAMVKTITKVMKSFWQTMMVAGPNGYSTKLRNKASIARLQWKR